MILAVAAVTSIAAIFAMHANDKFCVGFISLLNKVDVPKNSVYFPF
jgi:hypothetical protein